MECNILVVDDEKEFLELVERFLRNNNFIAFSSSNVKEGMKILSSKKVDLIISDVDMAGINGFEFLKLVRESKRYHKIPFILMSGKKITEVDILEGYNKGTDDYIIKPFSFSILLSKIKSILKRAVFCSEEIVKLKELTIDLSTKKVSINKKSIKLTKKEFELLSVLVKNPDKVFSTEKLLDIVWEISSLKIEDPHTVETHISSLRKKLGSFGKRIKNISGYGYKMEK